MSPAQSSEGLPADVFHLISAHDVAPRGCLTPTYMALRTALVETPGFSERTECPDECLCEFSPSMAYCPACLSAAIEHNHRVGVDTECAAVVDGRHGGGLDLGEEVLSLILTRVREGRIWRYYSEYLDDGRHVWAHVARALDGMLECDHLRLGEVGPGGSQRVDLAERGLANYTRLRERARPPGQGGISGPVLRDEADEPKGYVISGGCGCQRAVWTSGRVDECGCDDGSSGGGS